MTWMQTAVVLASLTLPALAQGQPSPDSPQGGPTTTPSGSYFNLSPRRKAAPRPLIQAARLQGRVPAVAALRPRVVCGMTLVPGDPAIDPGIVAREARPAATPSMRVVEPTICGATTAR